LEDFTALLQSIPLSNDLVKKILRKADTSYLRAALANSALSPQEAMEKLVGRNPKKVSLIQGFLSSVNNI
jgi:hypothetical protein